MLLGWLLRVLSAVENGVLIFLIEMSPYNLVLRLSLFIKVNYKKFFLNAFYMIRLFGSVSY